MRRIVIANRPGHASLIRTIIGGANIIELMLLVVDAVKCAIVLCAILVSSTFVSWCLLLLVPARAKRIPFRLCVRVTTI